MVRQIETSHLYKLFEEGWKGVLIFYDDALGKFFTENGAEIYNIRQVVPPWAYSLMKKAYRDDYPYFEFIRNAEIVKIVW